MLPSNSNRPVKPASANVEFTRHPMQTQEFINKHLNDDVHSLMLQAGRYPDVDMPFAVRQITGRQKMKNKVPLFYESEELLYPARLSLEQSSSQLTAQYKAGLCRGRSFADLTGGLGIDSFFISRHFETASYVERQKELCDVARHNFNVLQARNITVFNMQAEDFLHTMEHVDCIFIDPARRSEGGRKLVLLSDCEPDVGVLAPTLLEKSDLVLIKLSPMLDLSAAIKQLPCIRQIHVLAVDNECKETLLVLQKQENAGNELQIRAVNLDSKGVKPQVFAFHPSEETSAQPGYTEQPGRYLYEPNATLMKSGAFKLISQHFGLYKLHVNTHLYTSDCLVNDFPGRIFEITAHWGHSKKDWKSHIEALNGHANMAVRNYPLSASDLKKKLKLTDGGDRYLFACTLHNGEKTILECRRLSHLESKEQQKA